GGRGPGAGLQPDSTVVAGRSHWDMEHAGLPSEEIELRTFGNGQHYGRFMLRPKSPSWPSRRLRLVTIAVAEQAGRAFAARTPIPSTGEETGRTVPGIRRVILGGSGPPGEPAAPRPADGP